MQKSYSVPEIHCDHCVAAINRELGQIEGIKEIEVDLDAKTVVVELSEDVSDERIAGGLYDAGFDLEVT